MTFFAKYSTSKCMWYVYVCNAPRLQEIRKDLKFQELRHGNRLLFEAL